MFATIDFSIAIAFFPCSVRQVRCQLPVCQGKFDRGAFNYICSVLFCKENGVDVSDKLHTPGPSCRGDLDWRNEYNTPLTSLVEGNYSAEHR